MEHAIIERAAQAYCTQLECDGTARVLHYIMDKYNIPHQIFLGEVIRDDDNHLVPLHYWIELPDNTIVDYKLQMWLGEEAPNGLFKKDDYPNYHYKGFQVDFKMDEILFRAITTNPHTTNLKTDTK